MLTHFTVFIASKLGISSHDLLDKRLDFKDLARSIEAWERLFLRWALRWQDRNFDQQWLRDWTSFRGNEVGNCLLGSAPVAGNGLAMNNWLVSGLL
jgi:hypothetical protein